MPSSWGNARKYNSRYLAKPSLRLQLQQGPLNKALGRRSQPPPLRPGPAVPTEGGGGKGKGSTLTWPPTAPGPGYLSAPAAGTATLPSSACPRAAASCERGRLPPRRQQRGALRAPAGRRLRCCTADGNSCLHQWQRRQKHFGSSFSSLNCCQLFLFFLVQMNTIYTIKSNPSLCDRLIIC